MYKGPHGEALTPITLRELCVAVPLLVLAIWFGVYPKTVFRYMDKTIDAQVAQLADWSEGYAQLKDATAEEETAQADESRPETIRPASA